MPKDILIATSPETSTASRRRRRDDSEATTSHRRRSLFQQLSCLWNPAVGPELSSDTDEDCRKQSQHAGRGAFQPQRSASTFLGEDDDDEDNSLLGDEEPIELPPPEDATPRQWLDYYNRQIPLAADWTERANLYYTTGHLYVQCQDYEAATQAFVAEAQVLRQQGIAGEPLVPIYKSLAKLWTVRQPARALQYYEIALGHCTTTEEAQSIRHAMGRLYFQTGNLERAMQVSIGKGLR